MPPIASREESTNKLRKRLFYYSATALFVLVCSLSVAIFLTLFDQLKYAKDENLVHETQIRAIAMAEWFRRADDLALQITSRTSIRQKLEQFNRGIISAQELRAFTEPKLQDAMSLSKEIIGILRLGAGDQIVAQCGYGSRLLNDGWKADDYVFKSIQLLKPVTLDGRVAVVVSAPIFSRNGERQGTDLVMLDTRRLANITALPKKFGKTTTIVVGYRSADANLTLYPVKPQAQDARTDPQWHEAVDRCLSLAIAGQSGFTDAANSLMAYRPIGESGWGLVIAQNKRELYSSLYRNMTLIGLTFLVIYLVTLSGFWSILKPLAGKIILHAETLEKRVREKTAVLEKEVRERRKSEKALQEGEARYRNLFMYSPDAIMVNNQDRITLVNEACVQLFGAGKPEDLIGKSPYDLFHPDFHSMIRERVGRMRSLGAKVPLMEERIVRMDGQTVDVEVIAAPFHFGGSLSIHHILRDITERKRVELALQASEKDLKATLAEKEVLLKEIHHRVKNNMQVISSLVALQADELQDRAMRDVLQDVSHRVRSMAMVHEKLYQSSDLAQVDFADYAESLLTYLWRAHGAGSAGVRLTTDMEPVPMPVNVAVPCGLILNELVGNALKHAFCGRSEGRVTVSLHNDASDKVCLSVTDDGGGLPLQVDWRQAKTLGLRLVQMLSHQLHGTVEVSRNEGTRFKVIFEKPEP